MDMKQRIVSDWLPRYTGKPLDEFGKYVLLVNFSRGLGFMGFLISWLSFGDPIGILVTSFVVSVIVTGGNLLQLTSGIPYAVINILLAFTLFVVLARPVVLRRKEA